MPWAILIPILLRLVEWLLSKSGPLSKRDSVQLLKFADLSRRAIRQAKRRGLDVPDDEDVDEFVLPEEMDEDDEEEFEDEDDEEDEDD